MNKALLLALALIVVGCAEPRPRELDDLVQEGQVYLDRRTMKPYSGSVIGLSSDGSWVASRGTLEDGLWQGLNVSYYEGGQPFFKTMYKDGQLDGVSESYAPSGLVSRESYRVGARHGLYERYAVGSMLRPNVSAEPLIQGNYNMGDKCGEWIEEGETATYDPCPPNFEDVPFTVGQMLRDKDGNRVRFLGYTKAGRARVERVEDATSNR